MIRSSLAGAVRKAVALVAAALCVLGGSVAAHGQAGGGVSEDDSLILELHSGNYRLGDSLRGYQTRRGICVDLADVIQAIDLPIRIDRKSRRATGWVFAENERLVIDRDAASVQGAGGQARLGTEDIIDTPEGWCVDTTALSAWLGVTLNPDIANMRVALTSARKLPFLLAIERRSRAARLSPARLTFDLASLPRAETPYRDWRAPSVDVLVTGVARSQGRSRELRYEAFASGEALGVSYDARFASDPGGNPDTLRVRAYRNDPEGHILGPLRATQVAAGDVETLSGALTGQSAVGRGVFISNRALAQPSRFGETTLRGELPSGWDAELYRNGQLIAFQPDKGNGRYEFEQVELMFGDNSFEVVLYGPQGQVRRDRTAMPVGPANLPAGQIAWWAGAVEQGRDLVDFGRVRSDAGAGWRWGIGLEHGLDRRTSAGIEYQSLMLRGRRRSYLEATLHRALGGMLVEVAGAKQLGAGRALRAQALGALGGLRFQAETLWVDGGYESELLEPNERRMDGLRLSYDVKFGRTVMPLWGSIQRRHMRDGSRVTEWLLRASINARRMALTGVISNRVSTGPSANPVDDGLRLAALANTALGRVTLRGEARFRLSGHDRGFERAELAAETGITERDSLRAAAAWQAQERRGDFSLAYARQFRQFALRAEAEAGTRGNLGLGLSLMFSLGPDPADGGWRMSADRLARNGQAMVTVFRDEDGNGRRDAGEEPVAGVEVKGGFAALSPQTNGKGRTMLDNLRPFAPVLVAIDSTSLADPMLQPKGAGVVIVPRPGIPAEIELPLAPTGQVQGMLLGTDGEPREGVELELVDPHGQVGARALSEFDGYFLFDQVPYGAYRLRLAPGSAAGLGVQQDLGAALVIDRANTDLSLGVLRLESGMRPALIAAGP